MMILPAAATRARMVLRNRIRFTSHSFDCRAGASRPRGRSRLGDPGRGQTNTSITYAQRAAAGSVRPGSRLLGKSCEVRRNGEAVAHLDPAVGEPAARHLQGVEIGQARGHEFRAQGLEVEQLDQPAVGT